MQVKPTRSQSAKKMPKLRQSSNLVLKQPMLKNNKSYQVKSPKSVKMASNKLDKTQTPTQSQIPDGIFTPKRSKQQTDTVSLTRAKKSKMKLDRKSKIIAKLQGLTKEHLQKAKQNKLDGLAEVYDMQKTEDTYLQVLQTENTLNYDLVKLRTLQRTDKRQVEKKEKKSASTTKKTKGFAEKQFGGSVDKSEHKLQKIKKKALARYTQHSATYTSYTKLGEKFALRAPDLEMSLDLVEKAEAGVLGNIFFDFQHFKSIRLTSDAIPQTKIERRNTMYVLPLHLLRKLEGIKLSQNLRENVKIMKQLRFHIAGSELLEVLHFSGLRIRADGWQALSQGVEKTKTLKRVSIHNCNLAEKDHMALFAMGFMKSNKVEYIDLQWCDLTDDQGQIIAAIIKAQFELKESLSWRLGLRNSKKIDISSLGLKCLNLQRNKFGDKTAFEFARQLGICDSYLRCIYFRHNKMSEKGIEALCQAIPNHHDIISVDLRDNPGFDGRAKVYELAKYGFLKNIEHAVKHHKKNQGEKDNQRIKLEWIIPYCIGHKNKIDEQPQMDNAGPIRGLFMQFVAKLATQIEIPYKDVLNTFIGEQNEMQERIRNKLQMMRNKMRSGSAKASTRGSMSPGNYYSRSRVKSPISSPSKASRIDCSEIGSAKNINIPGVGINRHFAMTQENVFQNMDIAKLKMGSTENDENETGHDIEPERSNIFNLTNEFSGLVIPEEAKSRTKARQISQTADPRNNRMNLRGINTEVNSPDDTKDNSKLSQLKFAEQILVLQQENRTLKHQLSGSKRRGRSASRLKGGRSRSQLVAADDKHELDSMLNDVRHLINNLKVQPKKKSLNISIFSGQTDTGGKLTSSVLSTPFNRRQRRASESKIKKLKLKHNPSTIYETDQN